MLIFDLIPVTSMVILDFSIYKFVIDYYWEFNYTKRNDENIFVTFVKLYYIYILSWLSLLTHKTQRTNLSLKVHILTTPVLVLLLLIIFSFHILFFSELGMNAMFLSLWRILDKPKLVFIFLLLRSYNLRECNYFSPPNSFFTRNRHVPDYQEWEIKSSCAFDLAFWLLFLSWMYGFLFKTLDIMCSNSFSVPASSPTS